jgi:uncharacterized coiled-coil DUF342 family protein
MKKIIILIALILIQSASAVSHKGEVAKKKTVEAFDVTKEYTIEQKDEFVTGLRQDLRELDQKIDALKAKASTTSAQVSKEAKSQIASLDQQRMELNSKIDRLSTASQSAWGEMRSGIQSAYQNLKGSFNKASAKFNEQK